MLLVTRHLSLHPSVPSADDGAAIFGAPAVRAQLFKQVHELPLTFTQLRFGSRARARALARGCDCRCMPAYVLAQLSRARLKLGRLERGRTCRFPGGDAFASKCLRGMEQVRWRNGQFTVKVCVLCAEMGVE